MQSRKVSLASSSGSGCAGNGIGRATTHDRTSSFIWKRFIIGKGDMPFLATKVRRHSNNCFIRPSKNRRRNLPATVRFSYGIPDEGQEYLAQLQKEAAEARKERGEAVAPPASVVSAEA